MMATLPEMADFRALWIECRRQTEEMDEHPNLASNS